VALAGVCAAVVAGCGNDVPSNAVARVGDTVITQEQFDHWYETFAKSQAQAGGAGVVPDPPDYEECVAALEGQQPQGGPKPKPADLKRQCRQADQQLEQQTMQFLIQAEWLAQEADERDIEVKEAEVRQLFEDEKTQAFPKEKDYQQFLEDSGTTEADILYRLRLNTIQQKIAEAIQKEQGKVTDADVEQYYEKNKADFSQPERRDLNVVLTKTRAQAEQAMQELDGGANFKAVANEYSIDEASKAQGGKLPAVAEGQQEAALDEAVFAAEQEELVGPVKTQFGWYVFEVTGVTEESQQPLEDAQETIRNLVRQQREQKALQGFVTDFREEYKDVTKCREQFVVAECSNAPEEETETAPTPGGQQGAPAPQSP
jgi:foldase protein PrsA